jgi:DeoR/GlpR family transcriptional regulator of sugar metabolism
MTSSLMPARRQQMIADEVRRLGGARVADLVRLVGASEMTVRRDLTELAAAGLLVKVRGGAVAPGAASATAPSPGGPDRQARQRAIAAAAADLVAEGMTVALSAGDICDEVAGLIARVPNLTVITNSLPAAARLSRTPRPDLAVILTGGEQTPYQALVGPVAVAVLGQLHADLALISARGVAADLGLTTPNMLEADTMRAMIGGASRVALVADSSTWGVVALRAIAPLSAVDVWVCDDGLDADARRAAADQVGELRVVGGPVL